MYFSKGGVKLHHELAVPIGCLVGQCSHVSDSEHPSRGSYGQLGRHAADAKADALGVLDIMSVQLGGRPLLSPQHRLTKSRNGQLCLVAGCVLVCCAAVVSHGVPAEYPGNQPRHLQEDGMME